MSLQDHARFGELAAISAGGFLSDDELRELHEHAKNCSDCARAVAEFTEVVCSGLPLTQGRLREFRDQAKYKPDSGARERFLQRARQEGIALSPQLDRRSESSPWRLGFVVAIAGISAVATALALIAIYPKITNHPAEVTPTQSQLDELTRENSQLKAKLAAQQPPVATQSNDTEALRAQLQAAIKSTESNAQASEQLRAQLQQESSRNAGLLAELQNRDKSLADAKSELARLDQKRNEDQASTVALQTRVNELSEQVRTANASLDMERQLLAQGKEVRDLMGARQLHVVDVRDTDPTGKPGKAFGRVFLTEGKSLIFYAFDLNDTKLADAKHTYQVWGREEGKPGSFRSLGFLLVDDKAQRRWALKVDNPKLVSEIDSVFVTVEPPGGAKKPSSQRMLYANLEEANHP